MTANDSTPRSGESVSDDQYTPELAQELLQRSLQRVDEDLHAELREAVSATKQGELSRDHYFELMAQLHELHEVLEIVDRVTYSGPDREGIREKIEE